MDTVEATLKHRSSGQGRATSGHVSRNPVCLRTYLAAGRRRFGALHRWNVGCPQYGTGAVRGRTTEGRHSLVTVSNRNRDMPKHRKPTRYIHGWQSAVG